MTNLYEIIGEMHKIDHYLCSMDDEPHDLDAKMLEARLDGLAAQADEKLIGIWRIIKNKEARAETLKTEKARITAQQKSEQVAIKRLKALVEHCIPEGTPWSNPNGPECFAWRKSKAVEVTDESSLPAMYVKLTPSADKAKIGQDLKLGTDIPGAKLVERNNLQVR